MPLFTRVRSWYQKAAAPCSLNQVAARLRGLRLPSSPCIRQGASTMPARRVSQRGVLAEGSRRSVDFQLRAMRPRVEHARQCAQRLRRRRPRQTVRGFQGFRKRFVSRARYAQQQVNVGRGRGRETTRRGILDRIRFAEEQTSGGSLAEHGGGLSVIDTIVQRYDGAVSLERFKAGFRMSVMVDLAAQT